MSAGLDYELFCWQKNELCLGIDEAGRGPLMGELYVAGVILKPHVIHPDLDDSKKLSVKKRLLLFDWIVQNALRYQILKVDVETIDQLNIYQATKQAMQQLAQTLVEANLVLTDAMPLLLDKTVCPLVKGDQKSMSIAAASILAKVSRDQRMLELDRLYPMYGFAKHKGYPTKQHYEAIEEYGITPFHRRSFKLYRNGQLNLDLD